MKRTSLLLSTLVFLALALSAGKAMSSSDEECLDCHELAAPASATVPAIDFPDSVHGDFACSDCHEGEAWEPHEDGMPTLSCAECHEDTVAEHRKSVHGLALEQHGNGAADCGSCHGDVHFQRPSDDPGSSVNRAQLAATCGACHSDPDLVEKFGIDVINPLTAYSDSVHAEAAGNGHGGPSCGDCHGSHDTLSADNPDSHINRANVPETCGSCHEEITVAYMASVHGQALERGVSDTPVCTDCHGEHRILAPAAAGSPVSPTNQSLMTCGSCHGDLRLNEKYGLSSDKVPSYEDSYHGLAVKAGASTVASCASCHGVHDILPSSDPASHIHPDRLADTCSHCHAGAGTRFQIGRIHVVETDVSFPIVYYIRLIYLVLIYATIGGMMLHVGLDFVSKCRQPALRAMAAAPSSGAVRMMPGFRIAHGLVMLSFPVLVWTGFALTYPDTWWAWPLIAPGAEFRGLLHRIAAVVICIALLFHVIHLVISREARACMLQMIPNLEDLREIIERFKFYFGLRKKPVHSPQVGYIEKVEYLAFWWGMFVMTVTGLLLWFENFMLRELPAWVPAATTAVHFYEAVLASLAILIWHGYWTIFDPAVYPMDMSWLTGRAPASREWERGPEPDDVEE
jgi:Ni,Fe-hydrogenase I cytochrome b subunit